MHPDFLKEEQEPSIKIEIIDEAEWPRPAAKIAGGTTLGRIAMLHAVTAAAWKVLELSYKSGAHVHKHWTVVANQSEYRVELEPDNRGEMGEGLGVIKAAVDIARRTSWLA
jgi:hypothetical protein